MPRALLRRGLQVGLLCNGWKRRTFGLWGLGAGRQALPQHDAQCHMMCLVTQIRQYAKDRVSCPTLHRHNRAAPAPT